MLLLAVFIVFIIVVRKVVDTVMNMVWIAIASAAFPFVMRFVGFSFSTDFNSIVFFVSLGLGLYFVYILGRIVYALLGLAEKSVKFASYPLRKAGEHRKEKKKNKMEKLIREKK